MKKIDINKFKVIPKNLSNSFGLCFYGEDSEISEWLIENKLKVEQNGQYKNIILTPDIKLNSIFYGAKKYQYLDGFSPNLNKKLHIGHFSNMVLGKAFYSLGIAKELISIYGDTLQGEVSKEEALLKLKTYHNEFNFFPNKEIFASEVKLTQNILINGEDEYEGTKVFDINGEKIVGIKSNGNTSYFYQDVALAQQLNNSTLYLTGNEQNNHFNTLKKLFPEINHTGLGLVKLGGKMSSRLGNVIYMQDLLDFIKKEFNWNSKLAWNVFAGFILKSNPEQDKQINMDMLSNPKNSPGLYISYTIARLKSAGLEIKNVQDFSTDELKFSYLKSQINLKPNILYNNLIEIAKEINNLYATHQIVGNEKNQAIYQVLLNDLAYGCEKLGLFIIDKV